MKLFVLFICPLLINSFVQQAEKRSANCQNENADGFVDKAQHIMDKYKQQSRKRESMRYQIIAAEATAALARRMEEVSPFVALVHFEHFGHG